MIMLFPNPIIMRVLLLVVLITGENNVNGKKTKSEVRQMSIAAVFDEGGDSKYEMAFRHAVRGVNRNR